MKKLLVVLFLALVSIVFLLIFFTKGSDKFEPTTPDEEAVLTIH